MQRNGLLDTGTLLEGNHDIRHIPEVAATEWQGRTRLPSLSSVRLS